jgi:toxin HigB-1
MVSSKRCHAASAASAARILVICYVTGYNPYMIESFRHKGLEKFYRTGSKAGIQPAHASKLQDRLTVLDAITKIEDIPQSLVAAWGVHPLHGNLKNHYGLSVSGNWRMTFKITDAGNVELLDYVDYH